MTVIIKKEWLREYPGAGRLPGVGSSVNWHLVSRFAGLLAVAFITIFFFIVQNVKIISSGYEIEKLKKHLGELQSQNSLLTLEAASLGDLYVIEQRAVYELGMTRPVPGQVVYVGGSEKGLEHGPSRKPIPPSGN
jgi:hypothetical protein